MVPCGILSLKEQDQCSFRRVWGSLCDVWCSISWYKWTFGINSQDTNFTTKRDILQVNIKRYVPMSTNLNLYKHFTRKPYSVWIVFWNFSASVYHHTAVGASSSYICHCLIFLYKTKRIPNSKPATLKYLFISAVVRVRVVYYCRDSLSVLVVACWWGGESCSIGGVAEPVSCHWFTII